MTSGGVRSVADRLMHKKPCRGNLNHKAKDGGLLQTIHHEEEGTLKGDYLSVLNQIPANMACPLRTSN